jgi:hypothetical protein
MDLSLVRIMYALDQQRGGNFLWNQRYFILLSSTHIKTPLSSAILESDLNYHPPPPALLPRDMSTSTILATISIILLAWLIQNKLHVLGTFLETLLSGSIRAAVSIAQSPPVIQLACLSMSLLTSLINATMSMPRDITKTLFSSYIAALKNGEKITEDEEKQGVLMQCSGMTKQGRRCENRKYRPVGASYSCWAHSG